jgi:hypothetical protein
VPGTSWQWQLQGRVDTSIDVQMYDVDAFEAPRSIIRTLHRDGRAVVCYISAGSWENFRPDAGDFPDSVLGRSNGWPGERWLDIRQLRVLKPIMRARIQMCADKRFDGIEFDNVDGYANRTGFRLTAADQRRYNLWLSGAAHYRGLAAGLKNDLGQVRRLQPHFQFAVNEQCFQYHECGALKPFIRAGKAVFEVEYKLHRPQFCPSARRLHFVSMRKHLQLGPWRRPCW